MVLRGGRLNQIKDSPPAPSKNGGSVRDFNTSEGIVSSAFLSPTPSTLFLFFVQDKSASPSRK